MKIKVQRTKLAQALNYVSKAASTKPNIPVLANVLLEVKGDQLKLSATNLDMGINMWIPGVGKQDGSITASAKFLTDFVNATSEDNVNLKLEQDVLKVDTPKSKAEFQTIPATEFPVLPKVKDKPYLTLSSGEFINSMHKVMFACASDTNATNIQFSGVLFEITEGAKHIDFIGLNGFRLSRKRMKLEVELTETAQLIVPAKSLQEFVRILTSEEEENIDIYIPESKSQLIFSVGEIEFSVRLLEGPYPDYKGVIPSQGEFGFEVQKDDFERSLRIINTFARSIAGNKVNWDLDTDSSNLHLHAEVVDLGRNETDLGIKEVSGSGSLKAAYSLQFLMDFVSHTQGDTIQFKTNGPLAAAVFTDKADSDFLHLIMPVQRQTD